MLEAAWEADNGPFRRESSFFINSMYSWHTHQGLLPVFNHRQLLGIAFPVLSTSWRNFKWIWLSHSMFISLVHLHVWNMVDDKNHLNKWKNFLHHLMNTLSLSKNSISFISTPTRLYSLFAFSVVYLGAAITPIWKKNLQLKNTWVIPSFYYIRDTWGKFAPPGLKTDWNHPEYLRLSFLCTC